MTAQKLIVFFNRATHDQTHMVRERFGDSVTLMSPEQIVNVAEQVNAVATLDSIGLPRDFLARAENLEWVQVLTHGFDRVLTPEFARHRATLTNTHLLAEPVAEHAFAMLLALVRNIPMIVKNQPDRRWERSMCDSLLDKTMCVLGVGAIGSEIARRAKAFGMTVIGVNRAKRQQQWVDMAMAVDDLDEALRQSDVLAVTLPATESTLGLITAERLSMLKQGGYVLNVGRGGIIDEAALVSLCNDKHLAGAGLDVFETEPLPAENPLWAANNIIVSPHMAGFSGPSRKALVRFALDQIDRYLNGEPLLNVVKSGAAK